MPLPPSTLVILLSILKHFDLADKKCRIFYKDLHFIDMFK